MLRDRGDLLKYALAHALKGTAKIVRGASLALTVTEREAVAARAVAEIRNLPDDPWKLNEELPKDWGIMPDLGASTPDGWCNPG